MKRRGNLQRRYLFSRSTSRSKTTALRFSHWPLAPTLLFCLDVKSGAMLGGCTFLPSEEEVLLPLASRFVVTGCATTEPAGGKPITLVRMTELAGEPLLA